MKKKFFVVFLYLCSFKNNLNSTSKPFNSITNLVDDTNLVLVKSNLKKTKISRLNVGLSLHEKNKKKGLFFNYTDLTHLFKSDLYVSIDPKNFRINRDSVIKCLLLIEDYGLQDAMSSIKNLSPNDISFLLFKLYHMNPKKRDNIISFILENCSLEFDRLKFESLSEVDKKILLLNLSMPIHMAKKCFQEWVDEKYDINLIYNYLALSSVGLEYFLLLVLRSAMKYPEIDSCEVYSYRVFLTISKLSNDKRFSFSHLLETSNEKFLLNLQSAFEKKYIKVC